MISTVKICFQYFHIDLCLEIIVFCLFFISLLSLILHSYSELRFDTKLRVLKNLLEYFIKHIKQRDRPAIYNVVPITIFIDRCYISQLPATRKIPRIQSSKKHGKRPRKHLSTLFDKHDRNSIRTRWKRIVQTHNVFKTFYMSKFEVTKTIMCNYRVENEVGVMCWSCKYLGKSLRE